MKIAVCISGNLENWEKKYDSWQNLFHKIIGSSNYLHNDSSFDIFVHTWDFNITNNTEIVNINNSNILNFKNFLNPKGIILDNIQRYNSRGDTLNEFKYQYAGNKEYPVLLHKKAPELYGIMMAAHLKRDYEILNNFEYDMCFRLSMDSYIDDTVASNIIDNFKITDDKSIYMANVVKTFDFPYNNVNYDLFFANSHTFDNICSIYNIIPLLKTEHFPKDITINGMFGYFLRMFDMKINRLNILSTKYNTKLI